LVLLPYAVQIPLNGTVAPLDIVIDPEAWEPIVWVCAAPSPHTSETTPPPAVAVWNVLAVPAVLTPDMRMEHAVGAVFEVPIFWTLIVQAPVASEQVTATAVTCAELVNDPNRPKTNPAMAMAAMRVMAIRMTVARTGEIAFLCLELVILNLVLLPYAVQIPLNGTVAPLDMTNDPVAWEPIVWAGAAPSLQVWLIAPAPAVTGRAVSVPVVVTPPTCMLHAVGVAFDVPVFWRETTQPPGAGVESEQTTLTAVTCAELVNDPNRPKTNPAMAMAAMRVMAMRMTVASTGEMAFLFFF